MKRWLARKTSYTSSISQNELLKIMAHMVLRSIFSDIDQFAMIVDGTQDVQGLEQESICVRYVDASYGAHEDFVGLYTIVETTGASLSNMIQDALLRLHLPIINLRARRTTAPATCRESILDVKHGSRRCSQVTVV